MILGIGIDIVEVSRISERLAERILSEEEYFIWEKNRKDEFLAGRFALKEAFFKAVGTGIRDVRLNSISFLPDELGAIHMVENGVVDVLKKDHGFERIHVTLSHDGGVAVGLVVLETKEG